ncbi:MAG: MCE family protein [Bdellovibrionales bacterium]|jgi:phospholipid/cholesterol/gamma-HCH transport system substrate-binding protein|nr:MCE family protein [Bdellovibrionales bacterium]
MESNTKTLWYVGLFVILGIGVIMVSILMLGGDRTFLKSFVSLRAQFEQVQGLNKGSIVSLSGINIGNVEKIAFVQGTNQLEVIMRVEKSYLPRITEGSRVEIRTQGALGDKFVFLTPGPSTNSPLKDGDQVEVAAASDFLNVLSERGKETERVFDIINDVHKITKTISSGDRLEKMLTNFVKTSDNLNEATQQAKSLAQSLNANTTQKQLKDSIEKLESILSKLDKGQGTLGALINDSSLHSQLKSLLGGTQRKDHIRNLIRTSIEKNDASESSAAGRADP